jgi:hypothetical protein
MSFNEILEQLPKLTEDEQRQLRNIMPTTATRSPGCGSAQRNPDQTV